MPPTEAPADIHPSALGTYDNLNNAQLEAVRSTDGPVLLIAGPGTGKTATLVARTLHILASGLADPSEVVLWTFTEKAAGELKSRLRAGARAGAYEGDLSSLRVGTIHGISNEYIRRFRHLTPLGNGYEVLDELTQLLFLFEHFDEVFGGLDADERFLGRWATKWTAIAGAQTYFGKITEELLDTDALAASLDPFVVVIAAAYDRYEALLIEENRIDFAHLQRLFLDLLDNPDVGPKVIESTKYVMVDEYQDTNYVQERLVERLGSLHGNICVVGDEDQAIYRWRGATVRNILQFPNAHPSANVIKLTTNYRSHRAIVNAYHHWIATANWRNPSGASFRFDKTIEANPDEEYPDYPAIFSIWGTTKRDEAERFADLVQFLLANDVINDASQVALLLHTVRLDHSGPYIDALQRRGIAAFCPRARGYFENDEVRAAVACLAVILGWYGDQRGNTEGRAIRQLADYVDDALKDVGRSYGSPHPLAGLLQDFTGQIAALGPDEALDLRPADFLFHLLSVEPFRGWMTSENRARNLATLSSLLNDFQRYYHYTVVSSRNLRSLRMNLFNSFMRLLFDGGINEYEDPDQPFPKGYVQVLTIHQAKGLEFPVVVVGSLSTQLSSPKAIDRDLGSYYHRAPFEPTNRITEFDRMRLHYVAFSRAEKLLVLSTTDEPKAHFDDIWQGRPQWPYVQKNLLAAQGWQLKHRVPVKKSFSFTGDLKVFEVCPRQYEMYRHLDFTPSRSAVIFFGLLVHQTIEDIHRLVLDGKLNEITHGVITDLFEFNFTHLAKKDVRPIGDAAKASAMRQVLDYFRGNKHQMTRVVETEVDVSLEKDEYVLIGSIDLLLADDGSLEILDFKSQQRPDPGHSSIDIYYKQLCIYAHILEERHGRTPDRLLLYWTGERDPSEALMSFSYAPEDVASAAEHFDEVVEAIAAQEFDVVTPPERKICKECDFRHFCIASSTIDPKAIR